ncbi:Ankyrin repeat domain-containing protein 23 [Argiope bruennichi]|uniref:Ankyrin repeat domain-containing protein 23 n=1 Tax=Argiope bruennichi TaxID=94029 RepID=A0A8T0G0I0_ARGBR|nr:Ankyrin repeat domain-containing protein 23 [Argiope bruennichi]
MSVENVIPVEDEDEDEEPLLIHDVSNVEDLKKLLLSGANINEKNKFDETPLLRALCRDVDIQLIKEFLLQGADVNAKDFCGDTPMFIAIGCYGDNLDIIRLLLENGADIPNGTPTSDWLLNHTVRHNPLCAKFLIKYQFLKNSHLVKDFSAAVDKSVRDYYNEYKTIVDLDITHASYDFFATYLDECASEILQMKSVYLCDSITLLDFVVAKNPLQTLVNAQNMQQIINRIYKIFTVNKYKIYEDLVVNRIGRQNLLNSLDNEYIYSKLCKPNHCNKKRIILNLDLMCCIAKYLSDIDIFNIVIAFYT